MRQNILKLLACALAIFAGSNATAQSLDGLTRIYNATDLKDGATYYIVSDRTKFAGNSTGLPKAMSTQQDGYSVKWGDKYVYWGDLDREADGFVWTAKQMADGQWAFLNSENGKYLGNMNTSPREADVVFSATPVGYTLTDLSDGAGRFSMINSESSYSLHVQGYLMGNRPNNSLAKQSVGEDSYSSTAATDGYPGRWQFYAIGDVPVPTGFYTPTNGYYRIVSASEEGYPALLHALDATTPAEGELQLKDAGKGDPRAVFQIEAVDKEQGQYTARNYVSEQYLSIDTDGDEKAALALDTEAQTLTLTLAEGSRSVFEIQGVSGQWRLQGVSNSDLNAVSTKGRLNLARKAQEVGNPTLSDKYADLSADQLATLQQLWEQACADVNSGTWDVLYTRRVNDLSAAAAGTYSEPVYNKYHAKDTLTVASYNVKRCHISYQQTAKVINGMHADVVAIQEVDSSATRYQMAQLAEETGMYGIFCPAGYPDYGIGMLCKELPLSLKCVELKPDFERRVMLVAEFQNYVFCSIHVGLWASVRRGETGSGPIIKAEAERWVESGKPFIVAGDFNDDGTDDEMGGARGALTKYLQDNGFTYHSDLKTPTWHQGIYVIDNIISYDPIGGVEHISYEVVNDKTTSDHLPIYSKLLLGFDDPDGITANQLQTTPNEQAYDLSGRKINGQSSMVNGLNGICIIDGKKILLKK